MKNIISITLSILVLFSCTNQKTEEVNQKQPAAEKTPESKEVSESNLPELLTKILDAHGGLQNWNRYNSLEYNLETTLGKEKKEHQFIDLKSRKVKITGDNFTLGMDGDQVWVAPDKAAFGSMSARFYHNLLFYFFGIPFVLADEGTIYEDLGSKELNNKTYRALKVSFEEGTGDADDDFYIMHVDPETYRMEILLYTVTYSSGEKHERYNALMYDWQEVGDLVVPKSLNGYKYKDGIIGELRYKTDFVKVIFNEESADQSLFEMPDVAEIDSLKN